MKEHAYLFGPFVGEFSWEMYRFAPYAIHLRKTSNCKLIVLTRPNRFDLYGQYSSIFVSQDLNIQEGSEYKFTHKDIDIKEYNEYANFFYNKYSKRFDIIDHFYPDIKNGRYHIKWQYPRYLMDYSFIPRKKNFEFVSDNFDLTKNYVFIDLSNIMYKNLDYSTEIINYIKENSDYNPIVFPFTINDSFPDVTTFGCICCILNNCKFVIGNLNSLYSHLAILKQKPLLNICDNMSDDDIHLLNPFNTKVVDFTGNVKMDVNYCFMEKF